MRAILRPFPPVAFRFPQRTLGIDLARWRLMRREAGEDKRNALALAHGKLGDSLQIFPMCLDRRMQNQRVWTSDRLEATMTAAHPGNHQPVIEPDDQLHPDGDLACQTFNDPDH